MDDSTQRKTKKLKLKLDESISQSKINVSSINTETHIKSSSYAIRTVTPSTKTVEDESLDGFSFGEFSLSQNDLLLIDQIESGQATQNVKIEYMDSLTTEEIKQVKNEPSTSSSNQISPHPTANIQLIDLSDGADDKTPDGYSFGEFSLEETLMVEKYEANLTECHIEKVPFDVMENIFSHLPLQYLLLNAALVCQRWNEIIKNPTFSSWKKKYHKLRQYPNTSGKVIFNEIQSYVKERNMNFCDKLFFGIIKNMEIFCNKATDDMLSFLTNHPKYDGAKQIVDKEYPFQEEKKYNAYHLVAALVLISDSVDDIQEILRLLIHSKSNSNLHDLMESLYCIATMLYYSVVQFSSPKWLHYRVFYILNQYENFGIIAQQSLPLSKPNYDQDSNYSASKNLQRQLTNQQLRIVNHDMKPHDIVKIIAFAGTGKTSTLVEYTKCHPRQFFLNIVFNKSVCVNAKLIFPANVECRTAHSLAYNALDVRRCYGQFIKNKITPRDIENFDLHGQHPKSMKQELSHYRNCVINTLCKFLNSADDLISEVHVPIYYGYSDKEDKKLISPKDKTNIIKDATHVWRRMIDPKDTEARITHDMYLKLYQLRKPILKAYDCILVDEAQDLNPATLSIILLQKQPKIFMGDPHQQLYAFRGAVNALESIQHTHTYYLTHSFRFGPNIAYLANTILYDLKNVKSQTLIGGNQHASFKKKRRSGQLAILSRTNLSLFTEAVRIVCLGNLRSGEPQPVKAHFSGTINLKQLVDIYHLKCSCQPWQIRDKYIASFSSFSHLKTYAEATNDVELRMKVKTVELYNHNIPHYVQKICDECNHPLETANIIFSTTHKAKGMEFDTVTLADDFSILGYPYRPLPAFTGKNEELENEINLLYVAVTRAKKCLLMNSALYFMLLATPERFQYPVLWNTDSDLTKCVECHAEIKKTQTFVLVQKTLNLGNGKRNHAGGMVCKMCSAQIYLIGEISWHPDLERYDLRNQLCTRQLTNYNAIFYGPLTDLS